MVLKSLDVVEDERRARPFGQPRDSPLEIEPLDSAVSHRLGPGIVSSSSVVVAPLALVWRLFR